MEVIAWMGNTISPLMRMSVHIYFIIAMGIYVISASEDNRCVPHIFNRSRRHST